jgi:hypothetical protein
MNKIILTIMRGAAVVLQLAKGTGNRN